MRVILPRRAFLLGLVLVTAPVLQGCGKSAAARESEAGKAVASQKILQDQLEETKRQLAQAQERASNAERQQKERESSVAPTVAIGDAGAQELNALQAKVADTLKDPGSAQFRNVRRASRGICGEVNAKNGLGGYVGFQPFVSDETNAALWPGRCTNIRDTRAEIDCLKKQNAFGQTAMASGCMSQAEVMAMPR